MSLLHSRQLAYGIKRNPKELGLRSRIVSASIGELRILSELKKSSGNVTVFITRQGTWAQWTPVVQAAKEHNLATADILFIDLTEKKPKGQSRPDASGWLPEIAQAIKSHGYQRAEVVLFASDHLTAAANIYQLQEDLPGTRTHIIEDKNREHLLYKPIEVAKAIFSGIIH